jgi:hypothetical protein
MAVPRAAHQRVGRHCQAHEFKKGAVMKSVVLKDGFGIDKLTIIHAPSPKVGPGMILVKIKGGLAQLP